MKFIKKKNMQQNEELLYVPKLHWMFTVKHLFWVLPLIIVLVILRCIFGSGAWQGAFCIMGNCLIPGVLFKHVMLAIIILSLLEFILRVIYYLNVEYGVTNKRLIIKKGVCCLKISEIPVDRIESIYCVQGLLGRIFHYGTIYICGIGGKTQRFLMIYRPYVFRRKITKIIEKNKAITVIHGEMPTVKAPVVEEDPIYRYGTFVRVLPGEKKV